MQNTLLHKKKETAMKIGMHTSLCYKTITALVLFPLTCPCGFRISARIPIISRESLLFHILELAFVINGSISKLSQV